MNISQSKRKHELRRDPLVESLVKAKSYMISHSNLLFKAVIAICVILIVTVLVGSVKSGNERNAHLKFGNAMIAYSVGDLANAVDLFTNIVDNYKGTTHSIYSAYFTGMIYLDLFEYENAVEWLRIAASRGQNTGFISGASYEALMLAYEGKGDIGAAIDQGGKALNNRQIRHRHPDIHWKMALLSVKQNDLETAMEYCNKIALDTTAQAFHQDARNLTMELKTVIEM